MKSPNGLRQLFVAVEELCLFDISLKIKKKNVVHRQHGGSRKTKKIVMFV